MKRLKSFLAGFLTAALLAGNVVSADEQDLIKSLVGKWEGTVALKNEPFRMLTIAEVKRNGDDWSGRGRWAISRSDVTGKGSPVEIKITQNGGDVVLLFDSGVGNDVSLKLVGDGRLEGKMEHMRGKKRVHADASFKKIE
jgi:hypothetical protein